MAGKHVLRLPLATVLLLLISAGALSADEETGPIFLSRTLIVGGAQGWRYGFDYNRWARDVGPLPGDKLIFTYGEPARLSYRQHNVWLMKDRNALDGCQFGAGSTRLGSVSRQQNVTYTLQTQPRPYYFGSDGSTGDDCRKGNMKLTINPGMDWTPQLSMDRGLLLVLFVTLLVLLFVLRSADRCRRGSPKAVIQKKVARD